MQAGSAKGGAKGVQHLSSAQEYALRALSVAGEPASEGGRSARLTLITVAITRAELEAGGGKIDAAHASCLVEQIESLVAEVRVAAPAPGSTSDMLVERAGAWKTRLQQRHLTIPDPHMPELSG